MGNPLKRLIAANHAARAPQASATNGHASPAPPTATNGTTHSAGNGAAHHGQTASEQTLPAQELAEQALAEKVPPEQLPTEQLQTEQLQTEQLQTEQLQTEQLHPEPAPAPTPAATRDGVLPVVSVRDLTKLYTMGDQEIRALNGVDFDLWPGEMVAVMGPSGSGKSTFMNIIGCLDVPSSGTYLLDNIDVSKLNDTKLAAIRGGKIGFVFQSFNLLPRTTAVANVELPLIYAGISGKERRKRAVESLALVGLEDRVKHKPNELSGGQQQRVAIARALVNRPALILADEPTGNLDTKTSQEIMELFQRLSRERQMTILLITHEPEMAGYCDRVVNLRDGVLVQGEALPHQLETVPAHAQEEAREPATTGRDDATR
jgi:putative ABC transport system ATP-binding protein